MAAMAVATLSMEAVKRMAGGEKPILAAAAWSDGKNVVERENNGA